VTPITHVYDSTSHTRIIALALGLMMLVASPGTLSAQAPTVDGARVGPCPYAQCALSMERRAHGARFFRGTGRNDQAIGGTDALIHEVEAVPSALEAARRGQRNLVTGTVLMPVSIGLGSALGVVGLFTLLIPIIPQSQALLFVAGGAVIGGGGMALSIRQTRNGHDALGDAVYLYNKTLPR
jgi:hypothetical protein